MNGFLKKVKKNTIAFEKIKNPARGIGERLHKRVSVQLRPPAGFISKQFSFVFVTKKDLI